jgi:hypothetical protein
MTRNTTLRLVALGLTTLVLLPATGDPEFGFVGLFILWGLVTILLCVLFVALWGTGRGRASGGELK